VAYIENGNNDLVLNSIDDGEMNPKQPEGNFEIVKIFRDKAEKDNEKFFVLINIL